MKNKIVALQNNPISWALKSAGVVDEIRTFPCHFSSKEFDWTSLNLREIRVIFSSFDNPTDFLCELRKRFVKNRPLVVSIKQKIPEISLLMNGNKPINIGGHLSFPSLIKLKDLVDFLSLPQPDIFGITSTLVTLCWKHYISEITHKRRYPLSQTAYEEIGQILAKEGVNTFVQFSHYVYERIQKLEEEGKTPVAEELRTFTRFIKNRLLKKLQGRKVIEKRIFLENALSKVEDAVKDIRAKLHIEL